VITAGFRLPAKYIIHTAGPIYHDGKHGEAMQLRSCYSNSLRLALENGCQSITFPLISAGIYGYPKKEALSEATSAIRDFLAENEMEIYLAVLDKSSVVVDENLLKNLSEYIDRVYEKPSGISNEGEGDSVKRNVEPFLEILTQIVKKSGLAEIEVCTKANLSREWFSKIGSKSGSFVTKQTIIAFSVALKIPFEETVELLAQTGFNLSRNQLFDVIVSYFMRNQLYDIDLINEVLFLYDQPLLGS
ncbi:MAG TPA: macro domain-containing protein, partial [Flexilinea sp.]|nr:macro domain-containing protein [Flexilinea sp.]